MFLTPEQLSTIEDALEYSCEALANEFEDNKYSREATEIQRSVVTYGRLRRFQKLLNEIRKNSTISSTPPNRNNVLLLMGNRR